MVFYGCLVKNYVKITSQKYKASEWNTEKIRKGGRREVHPLVQSLNRSFFGNGTTKEREKRKYKEISMILLQDESFIYICFQNCLCLFLPSETVWNGFFERGPVQEKMK